jgi:fructose/tagatose bisphosphate aldolase
MNEVIEKAISQKVTPTNVDADMPWATEEEIPE